MKTTMALLAGSVLALTGCSTTHPGSAKSAKTDPKTVLVVYYVKPGKEAEFKVLLAQAWDLYRREHLVFAEPHILVQDTESGGKPRFVEIFTWVNRSIPENAPENVMTIWKQEESLCEERGGHHGIEPGEVQLIQK